MSSPALSVVVTTYRRRALLEETLASIQAQTFRDIEIVVIDDGSSPPTFSQEEAERLGIRYVHKPNGGQPAARNHGIALARGEFLAFVDDDDLWHPGKLEAQLDAMTSTGAGWSYCDCAYFEGTPDRVFRLHSQLAAPHAGHVFPDLVRACFVASPTVVVRRSVLAEAGGFNEDRSARFGEDWAMWMKLAARAPTAYVPRVLAYYRTHPGSMLRSSNLFEEHESHLRNFEWVFSTLAGDFGALRAEAEFLDLLRCARIAWSRGDGPLARRFAATGWRRRPWSPAANAIGLATLLPRSIVARLRRGHAAPPPSPPAPAALSRE